MGSLSSHQDFYHLDKVFTVNNRKIYLIGDPLFFYPLGKTCEQPYCMIQIENEFKFNNSGSTVK